MQSWDLRTVDVTPHIPHIVSSTEEARTIVLDLPTLEQKADAVANAAEHARGGA